MATLVEAADRAVALLDAFPPTADEVAAFLEAEGIRGVRTGAHTCPVANFLRQEIPGFSYAWCGDLLVQLPKAHLRPVEEEKELSTWRTPTNPAAEDFMRAFDESAYPHLDVNARPTD